MYHRKHIGSPVYQRSGTWSASGHTTRGLGTLCSYRAAAVWIWWFVCLLGIYVIGRTALFFFSVSPGSGIFFCASQYPLLFCCSWYICNNLLVVAHDPLSTSSTVFSSALSFTFSLPCLTVFCYDSSLLTPVLFCWYCCLHCTGMDILRLYALCTLDIESRTLVGAWTDSSGNLWSI